MLSGKKEISDTAAHFMAIAAMDQYGWLQSTYGLPLTRTRLRVVPQFFLPYHHMYDADPLPFVDITSDTISAFYAGLLCLFCHFKIASESDI